MNHALHKPMTVDEFLAWEDQQERKWEFDGFAPVAMVGGTFEHAVIGSNIVVALQGHLRGSPCRAINSDLKIRVAGRIRYPDAFVICAPVPRGTKVISEPVAVFEVLSESTRRTDHFLKNQECRDTPSIQRYVMLEQDRIAATVWTRAGDDWVGHILPADAMLAMPEVGVELPLAEFYDGVELAPPEPP